MATTESKVTAIDDSLVVYQARDLGSVVLTQVVKGQEIRLGPAEQVEGRGWMSASLTDGRIGYVLASTARGHTSLEGALPWDEKACLYCGQAIKKAALKCRFCGRAAEASLIAQEERDWALRTHLRKSGIGWLVVAGIQFVFAAYLSAVWGAVCLALGTANLAYPRRGMLIVNGVAMTLVGVGNVASTLNSGRILGMISLGVMQVIWGIKELGRYAGDDLKS